MPGRGWTTPCGLVALALTLAAAAPEPLPGLNSQVRYLLPLYAVSAFAVALAVFVFTDLVPVESALAAVGVAVVGGTLALLVSWAYDHAHGAELVGLLSGLAAGLLIAVVIEAIVDATVSARLPFPLGELAIGLALLGLAHFAAGLATPSRPSFLVDHIRTSSGQHPASAAARITTQP